MNVLDRILAGVRENSSIPAGCSQMLHNLAEVVRSTAMNPTAVDQLADLLHQNAAGITAAVLANTPTQVVHLSEHDAESIAEKHDVVEHHPDATSQVP